jgi:hypothetical protein
MPTVPSPKILLAAVSSPAFGRSLDSEATTRDPRHPSLMTTDPQSLFEPSDERLAVIKATGRQRRERRHARYRAGGLAVVLMAAVPLGPLRDSEPPDAGFAARQPEDCRNSTRPDCGPFRWDPAPAPNQPIRATVVSAGVDDDRTATVTIRWDDPDAPRADAAAVCWEGPCPPPPSPCTQATATGPWTPPPATPGSGELRYTHAYSSPGPRDVIIVVRSHAWPERSCSPGDDPYGDTVALTTTIEVPAP